MNLRALFSACVALAFCTANIVFGQAPAPAKPKEPNYVGKLSAGLQPTRSMVYKKVGNRELTLDLFLPADWKESDSRACFVTMHGGGWTSGAPRSMYRFADYCAKQGLVAISVQYRLYKPGSEVSVFDCVKDARSALRYVRAHAAELGIDPEKIIANGASAGGHLAAATALFPGVDEAGEDTGVSPIPNALVLFSPVIDISREGYGNAKVGERWQELSPAHQVRAGLPPTIVFHGTADTTTPFKGAQLFQDAMVKAGNRSELVAVEGAQHTYMFKDAALHAETLQKMDVFLTSLSYLKSAAPVASELKLPAIISNHMVLQADKPVAIWGWATPGDQVTVSIAGKSRDTTTAPDGKWKVMLEKLTASAEPQTLMVKGRTTLMVKDVLIGEVWLASGQSNMAMQIKGKLHGSVDRADEEIAAAKFPAIRMFVHDAPYAIYELPVPPAEPQDHRPGRWRVCSPETVADFSAIGYFFARDLHQKLRVPVGVVCAAVGGTPIEAWTSLSAQQGAPTLKPLLADWEKRTTSFEPAREQQTFLDAKETWLKQRSAAVKGGQPAPKAPAPFKNLRVMVPGGLFNGMIAPLVPYTVRGGIWYQGERNAAGPFTGLYGQQLQTMIADWRARWKDEFYFAWVQLPAFQKKQRLPSEPNGWGVAVRDEMRRLLAIPQTGMAITIDLGGEKAGHPTNKVDYAARLSAVVLHDVYRQAGDFWTGPLFRTAEREGKKIVLHFDHGEGLKPKAGEVQGFAVAGADQKFVWAEAQIDGERVIVSSDEVPKPVAVRYGWAGNPLGNLVNGGGLPASPFRSDDWK